MLVDFDSLSEDARIWIFPSDKRLTDNQESYISSEISNHLKHWMAHSNPLKAGFKILEKHFVIIALDESMNIATGCSIDTVQHKIEEIEKALSISLLNRLNVFCLINDKLRCVSLDQLVSVANLDTFFYDLTIQKKSDLRLYLKPIRLGWCKMYF